MRGTGEVASNEWREVEEWGRGWGEERVAKAPHLQKERKFELTVFWLQAMEPPNWVRMGG
jgi:hypothetical protein